MVYQQLLVCREGNFAVQLKVAPWWLTLHGYHAVALCTPLQNRVPLQYLCESWSAQYHHCRVASRGYTLWYYVATWQQWYSQNSNLDVYGGILPLVRRVQTFQTCLWIPCHPETKRINSKGVNEMKPV